MVKGFNFTKEMENFIIDNNTKYTNVELTNVFNKKYNCNLCPGTICKFKIKHKIHKTNEYTAEQIDFIKLNYRKYNKQEFAAIFNKVFGTNIKPHSLTRMAFKLGVTQKETVEYTNLTDEQVQFIKNNYKNTYNSDLLKMFNAKFKTNLAIQQLKYIKNKYKLHSGINGTEKSMYHERPTYNGFIEIKVHNDSSLRSNYIPKAHYVWEQHYGTPVPKDCYITYLDGNRANLDINNLALINKNTLRYVNLRQMRTKNKDIDKTLLMAVDLQIKANQRKKDLFV